VSYGLPAEAAPPAPACYLHPERETWIQCTRCARPICPECMTAASVGFQCPECVRAGAASIRTARTAFGGRVTRDGAATNALIGACAFLFVTVTLLDMAGGLARWGMQPLAIALEGEWFRLVTSTFLHAGWLHVGFNMYVLFILGPPLERVLGHGRFLTLYMLSGLGGSVASYWFSPVNTLSVGASGAIFGLMTAWIVVGRRLDRDVNQIIVLLGINVVLGFVLRGVDWRAHLGGALTGALVALALTTGRGQQGRARAGKQAVAAVGILVALVVLSMVRTTQIQDLIPALIG
jgi:membrane associated rhomboid family serine protease